MVVEFFFCSESLIDSRIETCFLIVKSEEYNFQTFMMADCLTFLIFRLLIGLNSDGTLVLSVE